ncbi:hypothetical protein CACET_c35580 [Clostridium aceticum]|uniref:Uncharacterized protein n=1 Tax=Clostridium aceticum TaxID=84022 RepID=A0A0D8I6G1_9CLOT|nr:hypothetical protein [Clostridium aceticum]AKL96989.1 hypothetical protein CACET_c35580 [Clostridium aceticum]KJF25632.1 hypothetical protein TZ02_17575 [Clostridium aceticum]
MSVGWSALGVGIMSIIWGLISYYGDESFDEGIVETYSKKFIILDEKRLINHVHLIRIVQGVVFILVSLLQFFHKSNAISIILVLVSIILMIGAHYYQRRKFLSSKISN